MSVQVQVKRLPHSEGLALPAYATPGAAGMDLLAAVAAPLVIAPGQRVLVPTGLAIALPPGFELQVRPRSGLALKNGIVLPNSPGTIDEDYRGELQVILLNAGISCVPSSVTNWSPIRTWAARGSRPGIAGSRGTRRMSSSGSRDARVTHGVSVEMR